MYRKIHNGQLSIEVFHLPFGIDDLCEQSSEFRKHRPRYDRGRARTNFLRVAKQKKPRRRKIKAAIRCQLDYLQRNLDSIDALIASGARLSGLKTHWWQKLLVISELHHQQSFLLTAKTRSIPGLIQSLSMGCVVADAAPSPAVP
jgi:hypothetical protein